MRSTRVLTGILFTLFLLEIVSRIALMVIFQIGLLHPAAIRYHYYPELRQLDNFRYDDGRENLLILAGSVLYSDTIVVTKDKKDVSTFFCDPAKVLPPSEFNIINLAQPGHNTLDSRYKYKYLPKKAHFDDVFIYHGINDTRTNNIQLEKFDKLYRHIEFYDDLYIYDRHPELQFIALPYTIDWLAHSIRKKQKEYIPRELFHGLLNGKPEEFVLAGNHVSSATAFKDNITAIIEEADIRGEQLILSTYAWYLPEDYTLDKFNKGELDYGQQIYPAELYGLPQQVENGLKAHNFVVEKTSLMQGLPLIDIAGSIPHSSVYFDDICHITADGCTILSDLLYQQLIHE